MDASKGGAGARPDVSVVVPAHDAAGTLRAAVESALGQAGVTVEVLVVDDGSSDTTGALAARLAADEPRLRALATGGPLGPSGARNVALGAARGRWVAMLDADDRMTPERLARMIALAEERGADVVLGNLAEAGPDGRLLSGGSFLTEPETPAEWSLAEFVEGNLGMSGARSTGYLKPLIRREFLERHAIRYDTRLRNGEDFHLVLALFAAGARVWFSPAPDYVYTRRAGSISHRADPAHLAALAEADAAFVAGTGDAHLRRLFKARRRAIGRVRTTETALGALRCRQPGRALSAIASDPGALPTLARHLREAAGKRRPGARSGPSGATPLPPKRP